MKDDIEYWRNQAFALIKYKHFHDHIAKHFKKDHPDWEVECKICNKTFKEITSPFREAIKKGIKDIEKEFQDTV